MPAGYRNLILLILMWVLAMSLFASSGGSANAAASEYKAWIEVGRDENGTLNIEAYCMSDRNGQVSYKLTTVKEGAAGNSNTSQGGIKYVNISDKCLLSTVKLNIADTDSVEVTLTLYSDGRLVAEATWTNT